MDVVPASISASVKVASTLVPARRKKVGHAHDALGSHLLLAAVGHLLRDDKGIALDSDGLDELAIKLVGPQAAPAIEQKGDFVAKGDRHASLP